MVRTLQSHARWALTSCVLLILAVSLSAQGETVVTPGLPSLDHGWWREQITVPNLILLGTFLFHIAGVYFDMKAIKAAMAVTEAKLNQIPDTYLTKEMADERARATDRRLEQLEERRRRQ